MLAAATSAIALNNAPTFLSQQIILGLNVLGFGISVLQPHSHYHVDLLGTGAFALSTVPSLVAAATSTTTTVPARVVWTSAAVATWSIKLGSFLFYRVLQRGKDSRMDDIMANPVHAAGFWTYSALWGIVCSLPYSLGLATSNPGNPLLLKLGLGIFGVGFAIETAADYQKWVFKKEHPDKFCNKGVWSIVQHPNYLGNLVLWLGILVANSSVLYVPPPKSAGSSPAIWQHLWGCRRWALALLGPAFMLNLFYSQATGALLPDSLKAQRKKYGYGTNPEYTKYVDETPLIIPNPFQWFKSSSKAQ